MTRPSTRSGRSLLATGLALAATSCIGPHVADSPISIPSPPREFRAAWVATVANIDWPSRPGLAVEQQKAEALAILDRLAELHFNAIVLQVRPQADALYDSELEPWSYYLTGEQGKAPKPYYDPLELWVEEAHARGLELHAWFNPYRANHPGHRGELSEDSVVKAHPERVVKLGDKGYWWMDPGLPEVQDHSLAVVLDVVRRYDIDGVHFDDYFYPYSSYNDGHDFPDDESYHSYTSGGGRRTRDDWRRYSVNRFIRRLYRNIKSIKPHVKFGISPFGIWRPGYPESIQGMDQFAELNADARRWLNAGWVDYFTPQLYWPIGQIPQSFPVLLGWWEAENELARHLWPGTSIARLNRPGGATELVNQIMITRGMTPDSPGLCMFSMKWLQLEESELPAALAQGPYAKQALIPRSRWLDDRPPRAPVLEVARTSDGLALCWALLDDEAAFLWVVHSLRDGVWSQRIVPGREQSLLLLDADREVEIVALSAIDRCGNESERTVARLVTGRPGS